MKKTLIIIFFVLIVIFILLLPNILNTYNEMEFNKKRAESYKEYVKKQELNKTKIEEQSITP